MPFVQLASRFPEIAASETRTVTVLGADEELPRGTYGFLESFCDEEGCDCRRAFITVVLAGNARETLATISYGWEKESFYRAWASFPLSKEDLEELKGPGLVRFAQQSQHAPALLQYFKMLVNDAAYRERIVRHYQLFRDAVGEAKPVSTVVRSEPKIGRNEPCPCGSGKKFKRCCSGTSDPAAEG